MILLLEHFFYFVYLPSTEKFTLLPPPIVAQVSPLIFWKRQPKNREP